MDYDYWLESPYDEEPSCIENPDCITCWRECNACEGVGKLDGVECDLCEGTGSVFDENAQHEAEDY